MLPEMTSQQQAVEWLHDLRLDIEDACDDLDWGLMTELNDDIRQLANAFPADSRVPALAAEFKAMKASYQNILSEIALRKSEMKEKLRQLRENNQAVQGYQNSLEAGNREVRSRI